MMTGFFSNFPTITYNGQIVTDITKSLTLFPESVEQTAAFSNYILNQGKRSDQVANTLYGDTSLEWVIWLANQNIDPLNGWYMTQNQFDDFVNTKYGDYIGIAQQRVMYYTNNWYNFNTLTEAGYEDLPVHLTKYWQPVMNASNNIIEYVRTQDNWAVTTNHLMNMTFANSVANVANFINDEVITIQWNVGQIGNAQVAFCSNNQLSFRHCSGYYYPVANNIANINAAAFSITGANSGVEITISNLSQITSLYGFDTLQSDEDVYYDPVTYYDYENNKNESKKIIKVIGPAYIPAITNAISTIFQ